MGLNGMHTPVTKDLGAVGRGSHPVLVEVQHVGGILEAAEEVVTVGLTTAGEHPREALVRQVGRHLVADPLVSRGSTRLVRATSCPRLVEEGFALDRPLARGRTEPVAQFPVAEVPFADVTAGVALYAGLHLRERLRQELRLDGSAGPPAVGLMAYAIFAPLVDQVAAVLELVSHGLTGCLGAGGEECRH